MTAGVVVSPTAAESFPAIGTTVTVAVTARSALAEATHLLRADLDALDLACSRFRDDSEIRAVERAAGTGMRVGRTLAAHLDAAVRAAAVTGGLVDPTVGSCLDALGYDRDLADVRDSDEPVEPVPAPGWRTLGWDRESRMLRVPPGVRVDLGSTAKGLGADLAAARIALRTGVGVLVDLGGDVAFAGVPPEPGWRIRVGDTPTDPGPVVVIRSGGLATSGTTRRRWRRGRLQCHHVVDPASGRPAGGPWRVATVAAGTCLDANIAATAAILLGDDAPARLDEAGLPARLVDAAGTVLTIGKWPVEAAVR